MLNPGDANLPMAAGVVRAQPSAALSKTFRVETAVGTAAAGTQSKGCTPVEKETTAMANETIDKETEIAAMEKEITDKKTTAMEEDTVEFAAVTAEPVAEEKLIAASAAAGAGDPELFHETFRSPVPVDGMAAEAPRKVDKAGRTGRNKMHSK